MAPILANHNGLEIENFMIPGRVVILNGPSSSGKTTIAQAVRDHRGPDCAAVSIDQFYLSIHSERENNWSLFYSLTKVLFASAAAFANQGFDVVVDSVFERPQCIEASLYTLKNIHVSFVGLNCPIDILERREIARKNRPIGLARNQNGRIHDDCVYDLILDTSELSVADCSTRILDLFDASEWPAQTTMAGRAGIG
jgi:chloramphenicol 3-O phosphotransferase